MPSLENEPNPDKPEWKKKKPSSGKSGTPKGPSNLNPGVVDKMAQQVGEDLVWKLQEKDDQDRQSWPKKPKKDSDHEAEEAARNKEQEEEHRRQKKKKKKEKEAKEWKEREEQEAQEAKQQAEKEQLEVDKRTAWAKLIHTVRNEKYSEELLELKVYHKRFITNTQRTTVNLDSHIHYLESVQDDTSLYPNRNVILAARLIQKLKDKNRKVIAEQLQTVVDKGFSSHSPRGFPQLEDLVMKPLYFIQCLQRGNSTMMDTRDENYGDDQNIGLHYLVSQAVHAMPLHLPESNSQQP